MTRPRTHAKVRLKYLAHVEMGQSPPSAEYVHSPEDGLPFLQGTADFGLVTPAPSVYCSNSTKVAERGDVLFSVRAPVGELNIAGQEVGIGRGLCAVRAGASWIPRFGWWALHEARHQLNYVSTGSTYEAVATEDVANLLVEDATLDEQRAIADYLDRETVRLDALVAAKERVLGLLAEKRRALITRAVTRGLDHRAALRDSGIPWLGEIPAHWGVIRLKFVVNRIEQGWSPECYSTPAAEDEWGVLKAGCCNGGVFNPEENKALPPHLDAPAELEVKPGDVLMSRASGSTDLIGSAALVPAGTRGRLLLSDKTYRLQATAGLVRAPFLVAVLSSALGRTQVQRVISGAAGLANNIAQGDIKEFLLPLPTESEQRAILIHIEDATNRLDSLRSATERTLSLLKERRAALISAAVTGRIDMESAA